MKPLLLAALLLLSGCATVQPYSTFERIADDRTEEVEKYTDREEYTSDMLACKTVKDDKEKSRECLEHQLTLAFSKINLTYPYSDQKWIENIYSAHSGEDIPPYAEIYLKNHPDGRTYPQFVNYILQVLYYQALAIDSNKFNLARNLYGRHVEAVNETRRAWADAAQAMQNISTDSRLDNIERNTSRSHYVPVSHGVQPIQVH